MITLDELMDTDAESVWKTNYDDVKINASLNHYIADGKIKRFKQRLHFIYNNETREDSLPRLMAPSSCIFYWLNRLDLNHERYYTCFNNIGYLQDEGGPDEILAELHGLYEFYSKERFVCII